MKQTQEKFHPYILCSEHLFIPLKHFIILGMLQPLPAMYFIEALGDRSTHISVEL